MGVDTDTAAAVAAPEATRSRHSDVMTLFAITWAAATLFHIWVRSGRITDIASNWTTLSALQMLAGAIAIVVLIRPRSRGPLLALAAIGPVIAWFEAPVLGSHWLVAAFVDVALLLSYAAARRGIAFERIFTTLARWVLIVFYSFAAFAKLNHGFFTPNVSCATYYLDELANSLHLSVHSQTAGGWSHLVPFAIVGIELSVPVLLFLRRTRHFGVIVGLVFHGFVSIDQT